MANRIREVRKSKGLTLEELAEATGISTSYLSRIEKGEDAKDGRGLSLENAVRIARALKCEVTDFTSEFSEEDIATAARMALPAPSPVDALGPEIDSLNEYDVRGGASYGGGSFGGDQEVGTLQPASQRWGLPKTFVRNELGLTAGSADVILVRGDSMDDGTINGLRSGDRVIIDRTDTDARQGGIFAVWDGGGVIIKQVEIVRGTDPQEIICKSRNLSYAPIPIILDENAHVIGRVAAKIARM